MPKIKEVLTPQKFRTAAAILGSFGVGAASSFDPNVFDTLGVQNSTISLVLGAIYVILKIFNGENNATK